MFTLNIKNRNVLLKDIKPEQLPLLLKWYNNIEDFSYATGIDTPITMEKLACKYAEVAICSNEFFAGIYLVDEKKMIGIVKGSLKHKEKNSVWISSIVIDAQYQRKGYGRETITLLLDFLKTNNGIKDALLSVIEDNLKGRAFWRRLGFSELKEMENHIRLHNTLQNVIIMHKHIGEFSKGN